MVFKNPLQVEFCLEGIGDFWGTLKKCFLRLPDLYLLTYLLEKRVYMGLKRVGG